MHAETNSKAGDKKTTITALILNNSILCGFCNIGFTSKEAFKDHITSVHLREKIYSCLKNSV